MSDNHVATRKSLTVHTGVVSLATLGFLGGTILKLISGGLGLYGFLAMISFVISIVNFRGAWKGFSDMEYNSANTKGFVASLTGVGAAILAFLT